MCYCKARYYEVINNRKIYNMSDLDAMRKKKQLFLIENVAEDGFDTSKF